jgi:predicted transcriptional regulator
MSKPSFVPLTRREREIVNVLFALGNRATVEDIRSRLHSPPGDSSVRVMLSRLERKGAVRRSADGPRNVYSVTTPPSIAKRTALQDYLQTFFGGSRRLLMMSMMRDGTWSDDDLDALRAEIDRVRKERRK